MLKRITTALILIALPVVALAAFPKPTGFVNDFAKVLPGGTKAKLEAVLQSFEKQTGIEVVIATLPSLEERPIEDVAVDLYAQWGIGKKDKDNGVLFLVAPAERKMRIEVGYGLEGTINDALAGRIMDQVVVPYFKKGDLAGGTAMGALAIVKVIVDKQEIKFDLAQAGAAYPTVRAKPKAGPLRILGKLVMLLVMGYLLIRHPWLFLFFLAGMGRGGGGGRGFGGGFGGFGGGLSGGGGASRGW